MATPGGRPPSVKEAVETALQAGLVAGGSLAPTLREEYLVAGLITRGIPVLRRELGHAFAASGRRVSVGGVFCHGAPKVELRGGDRCELGDLLVVVRHDRYDVVLRKSLLVQAKREDQAPPQGAQLDLYEDWPAFKYWRAGRLTGAQRSVRPHEAHLGAQFLELGTCPSCGRWAHECDVSGWTARSWYGQERPRAFARELTDVIEGVRGRSFDLPPPARTRGWDRVMDDLLRVTAERTFRVARQAMGRAGRGDIRSMYRAIALERCLPVLPEPPALFGDLGVARAAREELAFLSDASTELLEGDGPPELPPDLLEPDDDDADGDGVSLLLIDIGRADGDDEGPDPVFTSRRSWRR